MGRILIANATIVNEGKTFESDVLVVDERIEKIGKNLSSTGAEKIIDATGQYLFPGAIDDQVHFREPGLTHKGDIYTESRAAVAGGVTSFMEMPNTKPPVLTQKALQLKYDIAAEKSLANFSFFMGASNDNIEEVLKTDPKTVCGIKVFMGSSTGNMLVDDETVLENIFRNAPTIVAAHCEDETTIKNNLKHFREQYGDDIPVQLHPLIRSAEACYLSSSKAVSLARKHNCRLHILHISTAREAHMFDSGPLENKLITAEACIHHLYFDDSDYASKGTLIKWNPAVKSPSDKAAILKAVLEDRIDVVATDHAPHTLEEKQNTYANAPSGGPLVQHSLAAMLELCLNGQIALEKVVEKMCHNPAKLFNIRDRGFIREGYFADLVLTDLNQPWSVDKSNILYKCGWSPFEGTTFRARTTHTLVSGHLAYENGRFNESRMGKRLLFDR